MSEINEYSEEVQDLFIQFLVTDPELYVRCKGIIKPEFFYDERNQEVIKFLNKYTNDHNILPTLDQIKAVTSKRKLEKLEDINDSHIDWFLKEFEGFCRHRALEEVIHSSVNLWKEKRYGEVEQAVKDAIQIGLVKNLGTDYFYDPVSRLEAVKNNRGMNTTGWTDVDRALYGGFNIGEISIFAAISGGGKSLFLQNLAVNWAQEGLNVVYVTLELSENLSSMRMDAMISGMESRDILKNVDEVAMKVKKFKAANKGSIRIKQLPNGCTSTDLRAYVKEVEVQTGERVDAILVDYLDLMMPNNIRVSPSDMFVKDKYVTEELRNLAVEKQVLMATASQLNRGAYDAMEYDGSNISGGISKINTADNVIGIFTSASMRESGRYQIQFMKTRSSSGVGSRVDLEFDPGTLRISDLPEGAETAMESTTQSVMDQIKNKNKTNNGSQTQSEEDSNNKVNQAVSLREMLKRDL